MYVIQRKQRDGNWKTLELWTGVKNEFKRRDSAKLHMAEAFPSEVTKQRVTGDTVLRVHEVRP